ncbi:hypothetical protein DSO57_1005515 [Entomophthora muscae]|uniref:Uncharacterized protein n=1 Tax=Entomophthora muscae TaxID=34485 RepID=A0ACC2SWR6_9FUNG|nr:hypothetical protein DSO57_1005515 [Entomophthora muscae]
MPHVCSSSLTGSPVAPLSVAPAASPAAFSRCGSSPDQSSPVCAYSTQHVVLSSLDKKNALSGVEQTSPFHETPKRKKTQRGQVFFGKKPQLNAGDLQQASSDVVTNFY